MIVSASRRTDIPAFYMPWLLGRLEAGWCRVVNPFNRRQQRRVSLLPEDVSAIVFWTRRADRLADALDEIEAHGHQRTVAHVTLLDYDRDLERHVQTMPRAIDGLLRLADRYADPGRVCWRYDPILLGPRDTADDHRRRFEHLARQLEGSTRRVVISFVDLYRKTTRRLARATPDGYPLAAEGSEDGTEDSNVARSLVRDLAAMASTYGMEMQTCAEPLSYAEEGAPAGRCIDPLWLGRCFPGLQLPQGKDRGQREHCGCAPSIDIGAADSCLHGCVYCYAVRSHQAARQRHEQHDPNADTLIPTPLSAPIESLPTVPR